LIRFDDGEFDDEGEAEIGRSAQFKDVVQIGDIANRQPQYLDLGQLFVGRKSRQEFSQFGERDVERFDADSFTRRMRNSILECRASATAPFLSRQIRHRRRR
jgi:hypothetical protein